MRDGSIPLLKQANEAIRQQKYVSGIKQYAALLVESHEFSRFLRANLHFSAKAYRSKRANKKNKKVAVCCWSLGHNPAGRAHTLATIYKNFTETEIIGSLFPKFGAQIWKPLRNCSIPIRSFVVDCDSAFLKQAIKFVSNNPYDLVHLCKPRAPNIFFGLLYKIFWNSTVVVDIDDEELAFVQADSALLLNDYLNQFASLPEIQDITGKTWTRLAVGFAKCFDATTTSNPALQHRYGGEVIHHARDSTKFRPSLKRRLEARSKFGISQEKTVILFAGTPRAHKGLLETAQAIAQQQRDDLVFLIVGAFPENLQSLKKRIVNTPNLETITLPDQDFETLPDVLSAGDICVLLQDVDSLAAQYQTPAKLTDALAMGLTVLATLTPALEHIAVKGGFVQVETGMLSQVLADVLKKRDIGSSAQPSAHPLFTEFLSLEANQVRLHQIWQRAVACEFQLNPQLQMLTTYIFKEDPLKNKV